MISKSTEDLIESYTEEIKNKFPLRYALCLLLGISLYWGALNGSYKSALLGTLALNLNSAISGENSLMDIPIYAYAILSLVIYTSFHFCQRTTEKYIRYIANLPAIRESLEKIISNEDTKNTKIDRILFESLVSDFNKTREGMEKLASYSQTCIVAGIICFGISYFGNIIEVASGFTFLCIGIFSLHRSCEIFIQDLLPKRFEIRRILLTLKGNAKPQPEEFIA